MKLAADPPEADVQPSGAGATAWSRVTAPRAALEGLDALPLLTQDVLEYVEAVLDRLNTWIELIEHLLMN